MIIFNKPFSVDNGKYLKESVVLGMISYEPLWKTMKDRGVTTYTLIYKKGFSAYTVTNLRRNRSITMNTLEKLCAVLNCTPNDVVAFTEE